MSSSYHNTIHDFDPGNFLSSFFHTAKAVLFSPRSFYKGMRSEGGIRNPCIFLTCCALTHTVFVGLTLKKGVIIALSLFNGLVMPFVTAWILYVIVTGLFKGSGTYEAAFRVIAYSAATALISWVPMGGFVLEFYRLYLIAFGLSYVFSVKFSKTLLAVCITVVIYVVVFSSLNIMTGTPGPKTVP
jgi:hypothetical protein